MQPPLFTQWIQELHSDYILECITDFNLEANSHMRSFSLSKEDRSSLSITDVIDFLEEIYRTIQTKKHEDSWIFYAWVDEMAGQMRFSCVRKSWKKLPFACKVAESKIETIAKEFIEMKSSLHEKGQLNVWNIGI